MAEKKGKGRPGPANRGDRGKEKVRKVNFKAKSKKEPETKPAETEPIKLEKSVKERVPVVGIGASAGGVQALESFFSKAKPGSGLAYVVVQHLDPHHKSMMNSLLTKQTHMKVEDIKDGTVVDPEHVYIKPPAREVIIRDGVLHLQDPEERHGAQRPIDTFFRSLAGDRKEKAICVVLSGAGNDGTSGAKLIKAEGGLVMVQDEKQAQYPNMPQSVIDAGIADVVLPVEKMPEELRLYVEHTYMLAPGKKPPEEMIVQDIHRILTLVRTATGHDFTQYKRNTIRRRIERRMALHQMDDMASYSHFLRQNPQEAHHLFNDLTLNVTSFFRDREAFGQLKKKGILPLLEKKGMEGSLRIWVPGCATGEEAYSIAMIVLEAAEELERHVEVKIFATDISGSAIDTARAGLYPDSIIADVSDERLRRFFSKKGARFQVDSKIRDTVVFALHDLTRDPPFSGLDLISCRNLLIYLESGLQKRLLPILHYSLNSGGILFLGTSESVGDAGDLFGAVDAKHKIFRNKEKTNGDRRIYNFRMPDLGWGREELQDRPQAAAEKNQQKPPQKELVRELIERHMMEKYAPPAVLIDEKGKILYVHQNMSRYLSIPTGEPDFNLFRMVGGELHARLPQAIEKVKREREPAEMSLVHMRHNDDFLLVDVTLSPVLSRGQARNWFLVEFKESGPPRQKESPATDKDVEPEISSLHEKLRATRQELQATVEELEATNEELQSANEELQANNEELQSTNEELESSKEELQSTNEELSTLNTELLKKNQELTKARDDLDNLFLSTEVGTVFLDNDLRIRRFTPAVKEMLNLRDQDVGRPVSDLTTNFDHEGLEKDAAEVLDKLLRKEIEVKGKDNRRYLMRIVPYRTKENVIEGVIVTFLDTTELRDAQLSARDAMTFGEDLIRVVREPVLLLGDGLRVLAANSAFYRLFKTNPKKVLNRYLYKIEDNQWDIPDLRRLLEEIIPMDKEFQEYEVEHEFPRVGKKRLSLNARKIEKGERRPAMILLDFAEVRQANPE